MTPWPPALFLTSPFLDALRILLLCFGGIEFSRFGDAIMTRLPRFLPSLTLAAIVAMPVVGTRSLLAQPAATPAASKADTPTTQLLSQVDDFWHYAKIARYDLAANAGNKLLGEKATPRQVLAAFQEIAQQHHDSLDQWLLRWQGVDSMRDVTARILTTLKEGQFQLRADQDFIEHNIQRLAVNDRAFSLAMMNLRQSGELAYPLMLSYLADASKQQYHYPIMRAIRELGRVGLNPLVAATFAKNDAILVPVTQVLGEMGYQDVAPYLARLAADKDTPAAARKSAQNALAALGVNASALNVSQLFYDLGEKFYYGKSSIVYDNRNPSAYIWSWEGDKGLVKKDVPTPIYNDIMAMHAAADAVAANPDDANALSLWLAADYKRQADLPHGATDPTQTAGEPGAHFFGVSLGARYLNNVLSRALKDHNSAVARNAIKSLQQIVGQSNLFSGGQPVIPALSYPDRQVRFEAAFTLASALPQKQFDGASLVIPILAEALGQNAKVNVLAVAPQDQRNALVAELKKEGYNVVGASTPSQAVELSPELPIVDVIVFSDELKPDEVSQLLNAASQSTRLQGAGIVALNVSGTALNYSSRAIVAPSTQPASLKSKIEEARVKSGGLPLDAKTAQAYSLRSAHLLHEIAINRNPVFDLSPAVPQLLASLNDSRAPIAKAAARVLAHVDAKPVQEALLHQADDPKTSEDLRIAFYRNLADNAKFFGSHLDAPQVKALQDVLSGQSSPQIRNAAAEAQGALNLPADQVKSLILKQAQ